MIYKCESYLSDDGKEVKVLVDVDNPNTIKYTTPVPVLHPEMGIMEASCVMKVSSLKEAFEKIDSVRQEYMEIMEKKAEQMRNQLVVAQNVPSDLSNRSGKLIV